MKFYGIMSETITDNEQRQLAHPGSSESKRTVYIISGTIINNSGINEIVRLESPFYKSGYSKISLNSGERVKLKDIPAFTIALTTKNGSMATDLTIYAVEPSNDKDDDPANPTLPDSIHPMTERDYGNSYISGIGVTQHIVTTGTSTNIQILSSSNFIIPALTIMNQGNAAILVGYTTATAQLLSGDSLTLNSINPVASNLVYNDQGVSGIIVDVIA
jgi:hypothetical protein